MAGGSLGGKDPTGRSPNKSELRARSAFLSQGWRLPELIFSRVTVAAGRGQQRAVAAEGERHHVADVAAQRCHLLAGFQVPDLGGVAGAPRGKLLAVRMKGHAGDAVVVAEGVQEL